MKFSSNLSQLTFPWERVYTFNSCNTGTGALPDMYTRSLRAAGPRGESGHTRQSMSDCVTTIM